MFHSFHNIEFLYRSANKYFHYNFVPWLLVYTQNPFEVNLTIVGVKIRHDTINEVIITQYKFVWGYYNLVKVCIGLIAKPCKILYGFIIIPFIVMPYFNPNNNQIYLNWVLSVILYVICITM
jgi:hypothetical protein